MCEVWPSLLFDCFGWVSSNATFLTRVFFGCVIQVVCLELVTVRQTERRKCRRSGQSLVTFPDVFGREHSADRRLPLAPAQFALAGVPIFLQ